MDVYDGIYFFVHDVVAVKASCERDLIHNQICLLLESLHVSKLTGKKVVGDLLLSHPILLLLLPLCKHR